MRLLAAALLLLGCSGPAEIPDTGPAPAMDLEFTAVSDAEERTDCADVPPGLDEARAKHVTCPEELIEGSLAMGRLGDIVLENSRARFIVRTGDESATTIGAPAGGVIDAAAQGGPDLLKELFPLFDLASMAPSAIEVVDAGGDEEARVRVLFADAPIGLLETVIPGLASAVRLRGQLDYVLRADEDGLRVELSLTTERGVGRSTSAVGLLALLGGQELFQPGNGVLDDDNLGGEGTIVVGERPVGAIAIGLEDGTGSLTHIETIHIIRGPRLPIQQGELLLVEARIGVGETGAQALEAVRPSENPMLTLRGVAGDRVIVTSADGAPWIRSRFDSAGVVRARLPAGDYELTPGFAGYFVAPSESVVVSGDTEAAVAPAARAGLLVAASVAGDATIPVRVTVEAAGEEIERFVARGETTHLLPPGDYRVTVSHGLEYDVSVADLTLVGGATSRLEPDLLRVLDTVGWVSVDLHLHSDLSTDSVHPVEDAVRMIAAEGLEAASSTDHDFLSDYPAIAARAGVDDLLALATGVEVSTTRYGHINGYPLVRRPELAGAGAPVWFDMSPTDVFTALRALGDDSRGGALVQINHPRLGSASFFGSLSLDRETGSFTADPESLGLPADTDLNDFGFEIVEVFNGYTRGGNEPSFEDYLALYAVGRRFTMVGNSDTHIPDNPAGSPRSFVRVADDGAWSWSDLNAGLRAGEVTIAAGVFVTAELAGARVGDSVPLRILAQAPPWARTDRLRVYAGRTVAVDQPLADTSEVVRFDGVIDVPLGGAGFLVVRVDGTAIPRPVQHFAPMGVTNPILVGP